MYFNTYNSNKNKIINNNNLCLGYCESSHLVGKFYVRPIMTTPYDIKPNDFQNKLFRMETNNVENSATLLINPR